MNCIFVFKITFEIVDKNGQYYYLFRTSKMVVTALPLVNFFFCQGSGSSELF